jgi:flagellar motor switch protein FliM
MLKGKRIKKQHELTSQEKKAMKRIIVRIMSPLVEAWAKILKLFPVVDKIDTAPQFCQIVPPTEMIILVTLEVKFNDVEGMMNLCLPDTTLHPIADKLTASYWYSGKTIEKKASDMRNIDMINIPIIVELGRNEFTFKEITEIGEGTILELNKLAGAPLDVYANNVCIAKGEVVVIDENLGIRITEKVAQ